MSVQDRIVELKKRTAEHRKKMMELKMESETLDVELKNIIRELGVSENFDMLDLIEKSVGYSPIIKIEGP